MQEGYVKRSLQEGIARIEFFHPQSNSLPGKILQELAETIRTVGNDPVTKLIVLQSVGEKAFCAGASFDELIAIDDEAGGLNFFSGFAHVINAMRKTPQPIIARIHGKCVGGGVGVAAAADYAIAVENASIKLSELAVGIGPFVVGPVVERKMGTATYTQLAFDAQSWRSAAWAREKGLFAEVHESINGVDASIERLAEQLANSNPEAMKEIKRASWAGTDHWDNLLIERAAISGRLVLSEFTRNAIAQFKKK
ncbi:MAG: enoyl-CoA hydratase/isomerase family protein [Bacteroidota bacterium]|jgi:methylglutaconyl-CoA hydratase